MPLLKPNSIFQLTLIGFLAVCAPLILGLLLVAQQLDTLSQESQERIADAAEAMRVSRSLIEQTGALERNARQYAVLGDADLLQLYADRQVNFRQTLERLASLNMGAGIESLGRALDQGEQSAYTALLLPTAERSLDGFPTMVGLAQDLSAQISAWIDTQIQLLDEQARTARSALQTLALVLIAVTLLIGSTFILLITRPLRQMDRAIHQLGSGGLKQPVSIEGPKDLQELGARLDWLRRRLTDLEQQRTRFIQRVSHELKTPLTAIREGTSLLNDGLAGPLTAQQAELTRILGDNGSKLLQLIENLLRFRVDEVGSVYAGSSRLRIDKLLTEIVQSQALAIKANQIEVRVTSGKLMVAAHPEHLRIAMENLLANAIRFSPRGGVISLDLIRQGDWAVLRIADRGPGIPVTERARIFEAFYQGPPALGSDYAGTGLGLAIAREYLQMNGGDISLLDSEQGACFQLRLPLAEEEGV